MLFFYQTESKINLFSNMLKILDENSCTNTLTRKIINKGKPLDASRFNLVLASDHCRYICQFFRNRPIPHIRIYPCEISNIDIGLLKEVKDTRKTKTTNVKIHFFQTMKLSIYYKLVNYFSRCKKNQ